MAKKTVVTLFDDIDGSEAAETVEFGIDGYLYTVDLSKAHADELRDRLTAYREFGTELGRYHASKAPAIRSPRLPGREDRDRNRDIRRWAEENNLPVKARGKLPDGVVARYNEAHA
ncbi:histone-like nucleoid-structuring protein Lsr2 [Glycomyces albidus]|uniref:Lsr2 family protein n=1 Tax=Glycomyces albidus TaxID=2656774 RepID=A0A6L5G8U2_9ACTN|nr:Lsr2 family protein [Glycomyces albidus]MQM26050.1 Lsr2 family protein [Glycomyces albidus]